MKNTITCLLLCASVAHASDLDLSLESGGQNLVQVAPSTPVEYQVMGVLTDAQNEGLAMFCVDLTFDGGDLSQADTPTSAPLDQFAAPLGLTNPAGYGGTLRSGDLIQVGGAQNTILNTLAPQPTGIVQTGVAQPGTPIALITGQLTAPAAPGVYTLTAINGLVNVIRQGEDGSGEFWAVDAANVGTVTSLVIEVLNCEPSRYCTAKVNSLGCTPAIGSTGSPTLSGPDDFHVTAVDVLPGTFGAMFFGDMPDMAPFLGGTLCVAMPLSRTTHQVSGGAGGPPCTGTLDFHATHAFLSSGGLGLGSTVYAQYLYRDGAHPDGTGIGLTDALQWTICP